MNDNEITRMSHQIVADVRAHLGYQGTHEERIGAAGTVKAWLYKLLELEADSQGQPAEDERVKEIRELAELAAARVQNFAASLGKGFTFDEHKDVEYIIEKAMRGLLPVQPAASTPTEPQITFGPEPTTAGQKQVVIHDYGDRKAYTSQPPKPFEADDPPTSEAARAHGLRRIKRKHYDPDAKNSSAASTETPDDKPIYVDYERDPATGEVFVVQKAATIPPDFTEHPLRLVGQAERNGDLFLLFDGELGQHVLHQRTDDAEQWAAFTECSVGSITAREIYEAARPHLDHIGALPTTVDLTEQARQLVEDEFDLPSLFKGSGPICKSLVQRIASFAAEAATQGEVAGIERAVEILDAGRLLALPEAPETAKILHTAADAIRALSPDPSYLDRVRNAALEQAAQSVLDFDDWEWCQCSECKVDARSHAVNTSKSMTTLATKIRALKPDAGIGDDKEEDLHSPHG